MKVLVHGRRADFPEAPGDVSFCEEPAGCSCQGQTWETIVCRFHEPLRATWCPVCQHLTKIADERTIPGER